MLPWITLLSLTTFIHCAKVSCDQFLRSAHHSTFCISFLIAMPFRYAQNKKPCSDVDSGTPSESSIANINSSKSPDESTTCLQNVLPANGAKHCLNSWRPLLLFVPLRLGLTDINDSYIEPIKVINLTWKGLFWNDHDYFQECFHFEETMGIIGGRPNSAYYFIGYEGFLSHFSSLELRWLCSVYRVFSSIFGSSWHEANCIFSDGWFFIPLWFCQKDALHVTGSFTRSRFSSSEPVAVRSVGHQSERQFDRR